MKRSVIVAAFTTLLMAWLASAEISAPIPSSPPPADWWSAIQTNIAQSEYNITWREQPSAAAPEACWQAPNRAQNLRVYFTQAGPRVIRRTVETTAWVWGLELTGVGGSQKADGPPAVQRVQAAGNRISFVRDGLTEWYLNTAAGLEQGFTIERPPSDGCALVVRMAVHGDLRPGMTPDGQTVEFLSAAGVGVMHYGALRVNDALGKPLPATLAVTGAGSSIELRVDTANAVFPITLDPLATSAAWTAESNQNEAHLGASLCTAGDVNGDGFADILVGAPDFDQGASDTGCAFLYQGSAAGLSAAPVWTAESNQIGARFGAALSTAGDINGDGYADVLIGAPQYADGQSGEGRAFAYHGSPTGLPSTANWTAEGGQANAHFGAAVFTAGDINGDGYGDIIVGAPEYDGPQVDAGRAMVYYGGASGLSGTPAWTHDGEQAGGEFGASLSLAGDVNGDGYADVIVGAPGYDNSQPNAGRTYVFHGAASGIAAAADWWTEGSQSAERFGASVSTAGDLNGDGYADVIIGAPGYAYGQAGEGRACAYLGAATGLAYLPDWSAEGGQAGAAFGTSVAMAGDVNGDGYADVLVGAPQYANGQIGEGKVYAYAGSVSGLLTASFWTREGDQDSAGMGAAVSTAGDVNGDGYADVLAGAPGFENGQPGEGRVGVYYGAASGPGSSPWTAESDQTESFFGFSVSAAGDVNGDGFGDVIIGASKYDNGEDEEGLALVYYGSASGLSPTANWVAESNQSGAQFGFSVATAGDVNGDGYADVIIGAHYYKNEWTFEGRAFVYHGSAAGLGADPAWTADGGQSYALFGNSVATAGDVNGDGYADVIIGAPWFHYDKVAEGAAWVYQGSETGLGAVASWAGKGGQENAQYGASVSSAGDVNRDGYADILIGAPEYNNSGTDEGRAFVYQGSATGPGAEAAWTDEGYQSSVRFGQSVSTAGDVNGDGYADIVIGVQTYSNGESYEGRACVYHGSAAGLETTAAWSVESNRANALFGNSVSSAGDVNGDGYADIIVGAPYYSNGQLLEGGAWVYYGSSSGIETGNPWTGESNQKNAYFGNSVSSAGDVNGDGYADIIVGAPYYSGGQESEGRAFVYYGNGAAGRGLSINPRQYRNDGASPLAPMGANFNNSVYFDVLGRSPFGRSKVKVECEVKPLETPFDAQNTMQSTAWMDTGIPGVNLPVSMTGLEQGVYHWRMRLLYLPSMAPLQQYSRWFTPPLDGWQQGDFRIFLPAAAPSNPGASDIGRNAITWTWQDNSNDETGFKIWAGPGTNKPTTLQTITPAESSSYVQGGLAPNAPYSFQVASTKLAVDSPKTPVFTAWTTIEPVAGLSFSAVSTNSITLSATNTFSNLTLETSGIQFVNIQTGADSGWIGTAGPWISGGLSPNTRYDFTGASRNGVGATTTPVSGYKYTLAMPPTAPVTGNPGLHSMSVSIGTGDGNPPATTYAIQISPAVGGYAWIQNTGGVGSSPSYQTANAWGAIVVTGLAEYTTYTFTATAHNNAGVSSGAGPAATARTLDGTGPSGTLVINSGAPATNSTEVTLSLSASDTGTGVTQMRFSTDNVNWSGWEGYGETKLQTVSPGEGTKTVYAQFRDAAGNISPDVIQAGITLDVTAPFGSMIINGGASHTNSSLAALTLNAIDINGSGVVQMRFSNDNTTWNDWESFDRRASWNIAGGDGPKTVHAQFKDAAGNVSAAAVEDDIVLDTVPPVGSVVINDGAAYTTTPYCGLSLEASDPGGSGVTHVRLSEDGVTWGPWVFFTESRPWQLSGGDGVKTVHAQFKDNAANLSEGDITDTILLDGAPPEILLGPPTPATTATGPVTFTVTYTGADSVFLDPQDVRLVAKGPVDGNLQLTGSGNEWVVTILNIRGTGTLAVYILPGTARDSVGNTAAEAGPSTPVQVDNGSMVPVAGRSMLALLAAALLLIGGIHLAPKRSV